MTIEEIIEYSKLIVKHIDDSEEELRKVGPVPAELTKTIGILFSMIGDLAAEVKLLKGAWK